MHMTYTHMELDKSSSAIRNSARNISCSRLCSKSSCSAALVLRCTASISSSSSSSSMMVMMRRVSLLDGYSSKQAITWPMRRTRSAISTAATENEEPEEAAAALLSLALEFV